MPKVLFLCTGNYYRSRFAEELFNHVALQRQLDWAAESRALAIERGKDNLGPVSPLALAALRGWGVIPRTADRLPLACTIDDLDRADVVVALSDAEHRPLMLERFGDWTDRTEFWQVEDVNLTPSDEALAAIALQIDGLVARLVCVGRHEELTP